MTAGVIQAAGPVLRKDRPKTTPSLRVYTTATVNSGSTDITVTVDKTTQPTDFVVIYVGEASGTCSTPTGWTKVGVSQLGDTVNVPYLHLYTRRMVVGDVASDLGLAVTFSTGGNDGIMAIAQVFRDTSGFGIRPQFSFTPQPETISNATPFACSVQMGPSDFFAGAAVTLSALTSGLAAPTMTAAPTGCTIGGNVAATRSAGVVGTCRGLSAYTGPSHAPRTEAMSFTNNCYVASVTFTLAPVVPHLVETDLGPPEFAGQPVYAYCNSSGSCVTYATANPNRGCNTYRPWPERVAGAFGPVVNARNMSMGGAKAADICASAYGNPVINTTRAGANNVAGNSDKQATVQAITQTALASRLTALYVTDMVGNDFMGFGPGTQNEAGCRNAVNSLLRLIRAAAVNGATTAVTLDGSFAAVSSSGYIGGSAQKTTTPGGKATISITNQPAVDIVLTALDATAQGVTGAPYTVKLDGTTVATGTTHNTMKATGAYNDYKHVQQVVSLTGIPAGAHTITVEHAGASGNVLIYQGYMLPAATPPWIVANVLWPVPAATYTSLGRTPADAAIFNQIVIDAAAQFTDGRVFVYDPVGSGRWDTTVHVSTGDGTHQSEIGHGLVGHEIIRMLNERVPSPYAAPVDPTSLSPTTVPSTWDKVGTRDFIVPLGVTSLTIECEGSGGGGGGGRVLYGAGYGGGGGAYSKVTVAVTPGEILRITVAAGGAGGPDQGVGQPGGITQVVRVSDGTVLCRADGGTGGGTGGGVAGKGGLVANCIGSTKTAGTDGSTSTGGGGAAPLGGGNATLISAGHNPGKPYGGGGASDNPGQAGGRGADGVVKLS